MPTYQYRCSECGQDTEVFQKFSDAALTECPNCQGQLRKVYNAVGVVFKGSGFYSTDNRASAKSNGSSESSSSGSGGSGSSNGGSSNGESGSKKSETAGSSNGSSAGSKESGSKPAPAKAAAG